jgi:hypothetical protein
MKRTAIVRRTPLPRPTKPLARSTKPIARNVPVRQKREGKRRTLANRDEKYKAFVRLQWCAIRFGYGGCAGRTEAAHTEPTNGMASKGPDSGCAPLCASHHRHLHAIGLKDFNARYGVNLRLIAANTYIEYLAHKVGV